MSLKLFLKPSYISYVVKINDGMIGRIFNSNFDTSCSKIEHYTVPGSASRSSFTFACSRHFHIPMVNERKAIVKIPNTHISWEKCRNIPLRFTWTLIYPVLIKVWDTQNCQQSNAHPKFSHGKELRPTATNEAGKYTSVSMVMVFSVRASFRAFCVRSSISWFPLSARIDISIVILLLASKAFNAQKSSIFRTSILLALERNETKIMHPQAQMFHEVFEAYCWLFVSLIECHWAQIRWTGCHVF